MLFINSNNITCRIFNFSSSYLRALDYRLNNGAQSCITDMRMTNEETLVSGSFRFYLKHWKIEMHHHIFLLKNENYLWVIYIYIYIYIYRYRYILDASLLSIIRYESRVSRATQRKEERPTLHLSVVAIEKGAFGLPSNTVGQLTIYNSKRLQPTRQKKWRKKTVVVTK